MLNVNEIKNGLVIDHIHAGCGWKVFQWLGLDKAKFCCALIMNVESQKTGKKDIIKIKYIFFIKINLGFSTPSYNYSGYLESINFSVKFFVLEFIFRK